MKVLCHLGGKNPVAKLNDISPLQAYQPLPNNGWVNPNLIPSLYNNIRFVENSFKSLLFLIVSTNRSKKM
ncbi:MAG: hypothetical protein SPJ49_02985 [Bacilli bacterium]|nr:hypothetical protein [Bacilli bacterium]